MSNTNLRYQNGLAKRAAVRRNFAQCNAEALASQEPTRASAYARLKLEGLDAAPVQFAAFVLVLGLTVFRTM